MPNAYGSINRNKLEKKITGYIGKDIFDIHYAESYNNTVKKARTDRNYQYVMKYFPWCNIIIIWDIKSCNFTLNGSVENIELPYGFCKVIYRKNKNKRLDKIVIIHEDFLFDFLDDYDAFMLCNENDITDSLSLFSIQNFVNWSTCEERKKRCVFQKARDKNFRKEVLMKYQNQCAICRCNVVEILDAAHMKEHEVSRGNALDDDPQYGVCLCKNHHAMYDKGLIEIDFENKTITCNDHRLKEMAWFEDFNSKYKGEILCPNL